jgi:hypothetical protein
MKSYDYNAMVFDGDIYCIECLPSNALKEKCDAIFADSEWDHYPVCCECQTVHHYVQMLPFISRTLVKVKDKKTIEYILNPNGKIQLKNSDINIARLYWEDGELHLHIFSQIKKERFKKTLESEESFHVLDSIDDAINYLGEEIYE